MKTVLHLFAASLLFTFSQQTFAQNGAKTEDVDIRRSKEQAIKSVEYQKNLESQQEKIKDEQDIMEKEQKRISNHQKEIKRSEKGIEKTKTKIAKQKTANEKILAQTNDKNLSEEGLLNLKIKSKKQELEIQELKLDLLKQGQELDKIKANF